MILPCIITHLILLTAWIIPVSSNAGPRRMEFDSRQAPPLNFQLRVWKNSKGGPPYLSGYPELEMNGDVVVNKTVGYAGFLTALKPGPYSGKLYRRGTGQRGYLQPLSAPGHYQFKFAKPLPSIKGILHHNFTRLGQNCGGNCGGIAMKYWKPLGDTNMADWYVVPHPAVAGAWLVQYTTNTVQYPIPQSAYPVIMWASQV
ncbi:hypothetical protein BDD12DRAFT_909192 [Trichophaea hybrida]|nr:hypothetical protein BDD12DRAFT_909192 [Trichophaea hybrida]